MIFFPILNAPHVEGFTTIANFPPNNWEVKYKGPLNLYLTFFKDGIWHNKFVESMPYNSFKTIFHADLIPLIDEDVIPLLSLNISHLPDTSEELPNPDFLSTRIPSWRASLGLMSEFSKTNYQGEVFPFPPTASMLSLSPFFQLGKDIENYVLLMNVEKKPEYRNSKVNVFDFYTKELLLTKSVSNNRINIIHLDNLKLNEKSLFALTCHNMAFIPIYFSKSKDGKFLSIEHSHPPAEHVMGNKFDAQRLIKEMCFSQLSK